MKRRQEGYIGAGGRRVLRRGNNVFPDGLIGLWRADQYQATPRPYVPNTAVISSGAVAPQNLLSVSRRGFVSGSYAVSNATVTDLNATAPDGSNDASTVVWGSVDGYVQSGMSTLPAATYTLTVDVTTTDASTVSFRMGPNAGMSTKSATPAYQSFSATFAHGGGAPNLFIVRSVNAATPANLAICNARLHAGSVDLGIDPLVGNLLLGSDAYTNLPTVNSSPPSIETTAGGWGIIPFAAANSGSNFTVIAIGKRSAATASVVQVSLAKAFGANPYQQFGALMSNGGDVSPVTGGAPEMWVGGTQQTNSQRAGLLSSATGLWEAITCRYDGTIASVFVNDSKVMAKTSAGKTFSTADYLFSRYNSVGGTSAKQAHFAIAYWNRALTDTEVQQAVSALKAIAARSSITVNAETRVLCAEGDSITFGVSASYGYPDLFGPNASPAVIGVNNAVAGATLNGNSGNSLGGRLAADLAMIPRNKNGRLYIYTMMIGRNELVGYSGGAAQYATDIATHAGLVKAGGFDRVVLCTILPSTLANFNTQRNIFNPIVTAGGWAAAHNIDAICDLAADATMGTDAASADVTLYGDGTHPTNLGQTTLEPVYRATLNALV